MEKRKDEDGVRKMERMSKRGGENMWLEEKKICYEKEWGKRVIEEERKWK